MTSTLPLPISKGEWNEIVSLEVVREGWGLEDNVPGEEFSSSVYGVKFNFMSGSPGYCGDLYILVGDTYEEPLMLLRSRETGKLFAYSPSWGTYGDAPERLPSRVSLWYKDARRVYDTLIGALDRSIILDSVFNVVKLETGEIIDKLEKGYLSDGSAARHAQSMIEELRVVLKRIDAIQLGLRRQHLDLGSAVEMFARFSEPKGWSDRTRR